MGFFTKDQTGFRVDPSRAIYVLGAIDEDLVSELTPCILALRSSSKEPLYVVIDSPGGDTDQLETIIDLLMATDGDVERPDIITLATGRAASAAADLLCAGDIAVSYPRAMISFHGGRYPRADTITEETAGHMQAILRNENTYSSVWLATEVFGRVLTRYAQSSPNFAELRQSNPDIFDGDSGRETADNVDLFAFAWFLYDNLDDSIAPLPIEIAQQVYRLRDLSAEVDDDPDVLSPRLRDALDQCEDEEQKRHLTHQIHVLDAMIEQGVKNLPDFELDSEALASIADNFDFIAQSTVSHYREDTLAVMLAFSDVFFSKSDRKLIAKHKEEDVDDDPEFRAAFGQIVEEAYAHAGPLWSWTLGLCRRLNHGEYDLGARDAWLLGLIDRVVGWDPAADD